MDTSHAPSLVDLLRRVPGEGAPRARALQRLTEWYATAEALSALKTAAARERGSSGALAEVTAAAADTWNERGETTPIDEAGETRQRLRDAVASPALLDSMADWVHELRALAAMHPDSGACTVATALQLWTWTVRHFTAPANQNATAVAELADAFPPLLAARCRILEIVSGTRRAGAGTREFVMDLCHVQAARAAAEVGTRCAELVFGYRRHLAWDAEGCAACYGSDELDELEGFMPGIASAARAHTDVVEADGSHPAKAGPCARFDGVEAFTQLRARLDGCLTGARFARDRAAAALPQVVSGTPALT